MTGVQTCALPILVTGVISEKDALASIDLKTIFLFGGTLSLAAALEQTGAGELIAEKVIGMPANTMVVTAGGYTFKDYAKAGVPMILVATVVSMILLPIFYPFFPG